MLYRLRSLLRLLAVLLAVAPALAVAGNGAGNSQRHDPPGHADDDGDAVASSEDENGNGNANGNGNGNGNADGGNGQGNANSGANSGDPASTSVPTAGETAEITDEDRALGAVNARVALPLTNILALARRQNGGEFIDAEIIVVNGDLVYDVTLLEAGGRLRHLYYAARTGNRMVIR